MYEIFFSLPEFLRDELKKPLGKLVNEEELLELLKKEKYIVSVGDQVTYTLLKNNIKPIFCIIDYSIKRKICSKEIIQVLKSFGKENICIKNPSGIISHDLWNSIKNAFKNLDKGSIRIEVDGEEDLAALPAIFLAPRDVTIIYGLPNKGVVIVKPNKKNKKRVKEVLDKMCL